MNPVPISQDLWDIISKFGLCRTPQDELLTRFKYAGVVAAPTTRFATHVEWMLRRVLHASPVTRDMRLHFVNGMSLDVNVGLFADEWRIHNKWLTWDGAHEHSVCDAPNTKELETFTCDHAILKLWDMMMTQLVVSKDYSDVMMQGDNLRAMARGRLAQTPRSIKCAQTERRGQLHVTWESTDSYQNKDKPVRIVLHKTTCDQGQLTEGM